MAFHGGNLRIMRTFRGMTLKALADQVAIAPTVIWGIESGKRRPNETVLQAICEVVGVTATYFEQPIADEFTETECNFRRRRSAGERLRKRVLARGTLFAHIVRELQQRVVLPSNTVPVLPPDSDDAVERAAAHCRELWGLGLDTPITHMGRVLEQAGVILTKIVGEDARLDAFSRSARRGTPGFVVLNGAKDSPSRSRFDMAHELGHLVLHVGSSLELADRERQADLFASAFLLPRDAFRREFWSGGTLQWPRVFEMKKRWKVSVQAIIVRAFNLRLITAVDYQQAFKYLSKQGWRTNEPLEPEPESPELFRTALHTLWDRKQVGFTQLAAALHWTVATLEAVSGLRALGGRDGPAGDSLSFAAYANRRLTAG